MFPFSSLSEDRVEELEVEQEELNASLLALTTHFAQVCVWTLIIFYIL